MNDFRHASRALLRSPWYAATVAVVLGSGIALTTVVFALVDGVLFKPLPFLRPSELFVVSPSLEGQSDGRALAAASHEIAAWRDVLQGLRVTTVGESAIEWERTENHEYWSASVDADFFDVVGLRPLIGGFEPADFQWHFGRIENGGTFQPVLISHRLWQQMFGRDPDVVGRRVTRRQDEKRSFGFRVAGVLPPDFVFPIEVGHEPDVLTPAPVRRLGQSRELYLLARIGSTKDVPVVRERLRAAARTAVAESLPPGHEAGAAPRVPFADVSVIAVAEHLGRDARPASRLVAAAAAMILLLGCVNVAGLAAARNLERRRELALRRALGASGWQLSRIVIAETATLVLVSLLFGMWLARPLLAWTIDLLPVSLTLMKRPTIDLRTFIAVAGIAAATLICVSLWPAGIAARVRPTSLLSALGAMPTPITRRAQFLLVASQVSAGFTLMIAGGLTAASLASAWQADAGFNRRRTVLLEAFVTRDSGTASDQLTAAAAALRSIAGVDDVAVSSIQPLFARRSRPYTTMVPEGWAGSTERIAMRQVSANFFGVMGLQLVGGRWPSDAEWQDARFAIVSATAERLLWGGRSAVGQRLVEERPEARRPGAGATVIGVVADGRYTALDAEPIGDIYLATPIARNTVGVFFHLQTRADVDRLPANAAAMLRARGLRVEQASTHSDAMFDALKHRVLPAWLFGSLGLAALFVLAAGVLGLLAMATAQRTREIGIRMAIGATSARVLWTLLREQLGAVSAGLVGGGIVSAWAVRILESQLYGVNAYDPLVWTAVGATLVLVALAGGIVPAARAARLDPVTALRDE